MVAALRPRSTEEGFEGGDKCGKIFTGENVEHCGVHSDTAVVILTRV